MKIGGFNIGFGLNFFGQENINKTSKNGKEIDDGIEDISGKISEAVKIQESNSDKSNLEEKINSAQDNIISRAVFEKKIKEQEEIAKMENEDNYYLNLTKEDKYEIISGDDISKKIKMLDFLDGDEKNFYKKKVKVEIEIIKDSGSLIDKINLADALMKGKNLESYQ